jgi:phosphotriesterase-related protein
VNLQTVLGPVEDRQLAPLLYHEHVVLDNRAYPSLSAYWLPAPSLMAEELAELNNWGGKAVVSLTNQCMGRDVGALRAISSKSGVHILASTGYYTRSASPPITDPVAVARTFRDELENGIDGTGVRAAVIGEIGTGAWPLGDFERDLFKAAALAHSDTGAPIATHSHAGRQAVWQLQALTSRGVPADRVALGHLDEGLGADSYVDRLASLAGRGAYLGFDTIGITYYSDFMKKQLPSDEQRAAAIARLVAMGFGDRILIAHDICRQSHLKSGGGWGYGHIFQDFLPRLERHGVERKVAMSFLVENPLRWLVGDSGG